MVHYDVLFGCAETVQQKTLEYPVEKGGEDMSKYRIIYEVAPVFLGGETEVEVIVIEAPDMSLAKRVARRCEWGRYKLVCVEPLV